MTVIQRFFLKTEIVSGPLILDRLEAFRGQRIGIVTDPYMVKSGGLERIQSRLPDCVVEVFGEVVSEPTVQQVEKGAQVMASFGPDVILALGGGSAMDAAKAILAALREIDPSRKILLIAVPTTSGTGSEVTSYAVISDPERGVKFPLVSAALIPDIALLDAELVRTVPPKVTADTGMDVITHGLEAFASTKATDFSDAFAEKSLILALTHLPAAFANGNDMVARAAMHNASCMAGIAFEVAGLGLNHGIAHALGGRFHVAHGKINAMLLPLIVEYNAGTLGDFKPVLPIASRYAEIAKRAGWEGETPRASVKNLARGLARMNERFGIPSTLRGLGVDLGELPRWGPELVESALADLCTATNPRKPSPAEVADLIRTVAG